MAADNTSIDWTQIITTVLAVYGALLASYTFWVTLRDKKRTLKVELHYALAPLPIEGVEELITIRVSNPCFQNVTASSVALELPDKRQIVYPDPRSDKPLPHELTPGTNLTVLNNSQELAKSLLEAGFTGTISLIGSCSDAVGGNHKSKPFEFNINDALNRK